MGVADGGGRMRIGLALGAVAGLAALAACSGSPPPQPVSTVPTMAADPIDLSPLAAKPCTLLRPDQLAQFHIVAPGSTGTGPLSGASGRPICTWQPAQDSEPVYAAAVDQRSGARHAPATFTVSGYPGVEAVTGAGRCTVQIEVAKGVLLDAAVTVRDTEAPDYTDPCSDARSFAAAIIGNSQGQQP
jgi:hypothetical protein